MEKSLANITINEFETLFRSHYPELCGYANKYLQDLDASEETVQSIFVKLWENRSELGVINSIKSYLYSSVRNNCLNQIKHLKVRDDYKEYNKREIEMSNAYADDSLETSELEEKIQRSIGSLPEKRKKIFILSRYEGLKYKEIAEKLDISVKTVEHQMGSALKQLKNDLSEYLVAIAIFLITMFK